MVTHAAGESAADFCFYHEDPSFRFKGATAVVLAAKNEAHLRSIEDYLTQEGLQDYSRVVESSEPYRNQLMAIGLWPAERSYFGTSLTHFNLLNSCFELDNL
jgi:hypothetical protein